MAAKTKTDAVAPTMLTGDELLQFNDAKMAEGFAVREIATQAGYYSETPEKGTRVKLALFQRALLEASGLIPPVARRARAAGTGPSVLHVNTNGQLVIGPRYLAAIAEKGDEYTVSVDAETKTVTLSPVYEEEAEVEVEEFEEVEELVAA
jgi:hypothetical protein